MRRPLVSVCLPNLNTRPYLAERFETIQRQTYTNWELIVSDNYSDDGAWEFFEGLARADERVHIAQAPRTGMYDNWNRCIARARGEFVYIATSDDTMAPDCLEKLVSALEAHPSCGVAHCMLRKIDAGGETLSDEWWTQHSLFAKSSKALLYRPHIRRAPFDGLLHLLGASVYISITQLLIRRSLFDRVGLFEARWGSVGDFNWNMRAGLVADTIHVPDTWGGWRKHVTQATASVALRSETHASKVDEMIADAVQRCEYLLEPEIRARLQSEWLVEAEEIRKFRRELGDAWSPLARRAFIVKRALQGAQPARERLRPSVWRRSFPEWMSGRLAQVGFDRPLVTVGQVAPAQNLPLMRV